MLAALFTVHSSLLVSTALAQTVDSWNDAFVNQPMNVRYESHSPVRLAFNSQQDFAVAYGGYQLLKGDFHAIDQSADAHYVDVFIGGLRRIKNFSLAGHINYKNQKDNEQSWNSTLWNLPNNPFTLCDSVPGDATTESYDIRATAAYECGTHLKLGLDIGLRTGHRSDQNDPRPRSTTSQLPITAGIDYQITDNWSTGLLAGLSFTSSVIEYTSVQPTVTYRYFLMKGVGDYAKRSSSDESGYKRDYQGTNYHAALNATWQPKNGCMANFLELQVAANSQEATDGGLSYTFHGGEYRETVFSFHNRFQLRNTAFIHNLTLNAAYTDGKGIWYDQKRLTDIEHGSVIYYEVLSKNTNHKLQCLDASLRYQFDLFDAEGRQDLFAALSGTMESITRKQLLGDATPKQEIQTVDLALEVGKAFYMNKVTLLAQLNGGLRTPQKQTYASGCIYTDDENIDAVYTRHVFEYETAQSWRIGATVDASMPVSDKLTAGIYAKGRYQAYSGKNDYWQGYDGTHLTTADFGAYIKF